MNDISITLGTSPATGLPVTVSLAKAPHILVAGMTGSGKSMFIQSVICELVDRPSREIILVLVDPKRVEFSMWAGISHLAWPEVVSELTDIDMALKWAEAEMRMRFHKMSKQGARDISQMPSPWARLVVIIDELANLVLASKGLERRIVTLASMGRAAGVHLILATQRPSADVITGLIRANVPTRICLPVITKIESRIVLDVAGGEELVNPGDMLIRLPGQRELVRAKGRYVSDQTIQSAIKRAI